MLHSRKPQCFRDGVCVFASDSEPGRLVSKGDWLGLLNELCAMAIGAIVSGNGTSKMANNERTVSRKMRRWATIARLW